MDAINGPFELLAFYNDRGTAEQHFKEGKHAIRGTRLSCMRFAAIRLTDCKFSRVALDIPLYFSSHIAADMVVLKLA